MRIVVALSSLGIGGTESYALTVAEQLDRLAHDVIVYTPEPGPGAEVASQRGLAVRNAGAPPAEADVAISQDAGAAFEMAEFCPAAKQVFVAHSESFDPQAPPQIPGVVDVAVALNDRVAARLRAFAGELRIERLRQPIDTERFLARGALPSRPRRALLLSNNHVADRRELIEAACAGAGLELLRIGGRDEQSSDPQPQLASADLVIGYGRSVLEAMACGRAAFVYDWSGGEGWVTADSYAAMEADGFAGRDRQVIDADGLARSLRAYDASMGPVNRDLVVAHHRANVHAQELVGLFGEIADPQPRPDAPLGAMARLVRLEWRARMEVHRLMVENAEQQARLLEVEEELAEVRAFERTLSWRLTRPLRALGRLRTRLRRR